MWGWVVAGAAILLIGAGAFMACRSNRAADVEAAGVRSASIPVAEISGLARLDVDGASYLVSVGDESASVVLTRMDATGTLGTPRSIPLPIPQAATADKGSDFEAVTTDARGRIWVQREGAQVVFVVEDAHRGAPRLVARYDLTIPKDHPLADDWADDDNKRGEGLVRLPEGHLLIAKQRDPMALIEFGPADDHPLGVMGPPDAADDTLLPSGSLVPRAYWVMSKKRAKKRGVRSLNGLSWRDDGRLAVVGSKPEAWLAMVALPLKPAVDGFDLDAVTFVKINVGGNLEGVAVTPDGTWVLGLDKGATEENILLIRR